MSKAYVSPGFFVVIRNTDDGRALWWKGGDKWTENKAEASALSAVAQDTLRSVRVPEGNWKGPAIQWEN